MIQNSIGQLIEIQVNGGGWLTQSAPTNHHQFYKRKILAPSERPEDYREVTQAERTALETADAKWQPLPSEFLEGFNTLWLAAVRTTYGFSGGLNPDNTERPYHLHGIDLTHQEAVEIFIQGRPLPMTSQYFGSPMKTHLPRRNYFVSLPASAMFFNCSELEVAEPGAVAIDDNAFRLCPNLRTVGANSTYCFLNTSIGNNTFAGCVSLEFVKGKISGSKPINVKDSPKLTLQNFRYWIDNATQTAAVTITVHPDIFAKMTDPDNSEWHALIADGAAKNLTFVTV